MAESDLEKGLETPAAEAGQVEQPRETDAAEIVNVEPVAADVDAGLRSTPNLYDEVRTAMAGSFFIFAMADIRDMAKKGELKSEHPEYIQHLMDFPIDSFEFITLYRENKDIIQQRIDSQERYELYDSFFEVPENADAAEVEQYLRSLQFLHFADANAEEECVFGLAINHLKKRVTVAFRGSVTAKDFSQDVKV